MTNVPFKTKTISNREHSATDELVVPETDDLTEASFGKSCTAERRFRQLRERHWTMLICALVVVLFAFLMQEVEGGRVAVLGLERFPLPELCGSKAWFGVECPGCGLTRSFLALADGDLAGSLRLHPVGWLLALSVVLQFPYRISALHDLRTGLSDRIWPKWFGYFLIAALILAWLVNAILKL